MKSQTRRLPSGGQIDRSRTLAFSFDGRAYEGYAGDTLASALLANGASIAGRSFKLHRPRGVYGSWSEEPNVIVQVGTGRTATPNLKATQVELFDGLEARAVNCWPSARWDVSGALQLLAPLIPAGFYYKTFMWPRWRWFEPLIRRAAGLGTVPTAADASRYEERHEHCDVLVVGGGAAGLSAALAATRVGARVVLLDDRPDLGGALRWKEEPVDGRPPLDWITAVTGELRTSVQARVLTRSTAFGYYDHNLVAVLERAESGPARDGAVRERLWHLRASQVVLATGAIERPLVFANNDLPGTMLASAAMQYAVQYSVRPGRRAVFLTSCDSAYASAAALQARGVTIAAIADLRREPGEVAERAQRSGIRVLPGFGPARAYGFRSVRGIEIRALEADGKRWRSGAGERIGCDLLCVSGGWTPTVHLYSQAGGVSRYVRELGGLVGERWGAVHCAGGIAGAFSLDVCISQGLAAGELAAGRCGKLGSCADRPGTPTSTPDSRTASPGRISCGPSPDPPGRAWIDLQNDVTYADLELATRENLRSIEHIKRYTTNGMAVDQGKTSNINALHALGDLTNRTAAELGTTTFRPPYDPVTLGALAARRSGEFLHPMRRTPLHHWHEDHGGVLEDFGGWMRPAWYARAKQSREDCVRGEKQTARRAVSLFDGSPLGKLQVCGPDALEFLNRMYYQNMTGLADGRVRYGVMLNEHGIVIDDGVCMRLREMEYLVSTTSAGAARIFAQFEEWLQCEWPELRVLLTNVSSQWGSIAVAGPAARMLLQRIQPDVELAVAAFPHLAVREGKLAGIPVRIARVSFTGELSFEIQIASNWTESLWNALLASGEDLDVAPIGIDALQELRTEKGFLHVGTDTDGRTIPADIGMAGVLTRKSNDFIGRRSLERSDAQRPDRLQFVGIAAADPYCVLPVGAHVISDAPPEDRASSVSQGYVTSSCYSDALRRGVALGLVSAGRRRTGEPVRVRFNGESWRARIVAPVWYDPEGSRLHA